MTHCQQKLEEFNQTVDQLENLMDTHLSDWPTLEKAWQDFKAELEWAVHSDLPSFQSEIERREQ